IGLPIALAAANSFGWIFTEMGRQPWVVFGLMTTERGVSPGVSVTEALISVVVLTALYGVLAVIEIGLLAKFTKKGPEPFVEPPDPGSPDHDTDAPLAFAYCPADQRQAGEEEDDDLRHRAHHGLVRAHRVLVDRLLRARGVRLRRRHARAGARPRRDGAAGHDQHHRSALGRQRGVGPGRRRRDVRSVPGVVRDAVQRILPAAAADPGRTAPAQPEI